MNDSVNYAVGSAKIIRLPGDTYSHDDFDVSISYRYQNRTSDFVTLSRRDGVRMRVRPSKRFSTVDEFRVFATYTADRDVINNSAKILDESSNSGVERDKILRSMRKALVQSSGQTVVSTIEYVVTESQIKQAGGRLYLADLDLLIEMGKPKPMLHPYSHSGIDRKRIDSLMPSCSNNTMAFMFKAVDNNDCKIFSDRYINIGGMVFRIPVERDDSLVTGLHVVSRSPIDVKTVNSVNELNELDSFFYTFEEADKKFGLYLTAEEAKVAGPLAEAIKEETNLILAKDKLELTREERDLQKLKHIQQQQRMELDIQLNGSKSFLEYSKIGVGILGSVVAVLTIWQKLASK